MIQQAAVHGFYSAEVTLPAGGSIWRAKRLVRLLAAHASGDNDYPMNLGSGAFGLAQRRAAGRRAPAVEHRLGGKI